MTPVVKWSPTIQLGHVVQTVASVIMICGAGFGVYLGILSAIHQQDSQALRQEAEIQLNKQSIEQLKAEFAQFREDNRSMVKDTRDSLKEITGKVDNISNLVSGLAAARR